MVTVELGEWIYALLARLEKPLHLDIAANVRLLYRESCRMRAALQDRSISDNEESDVDTLLPILNTFIAITGSYFSQGEDFVPLATEEDVEVTPESDSDDQQSDYSVSREDVIDFNVMSYGDACLDNELEDGEEDEKVQDVV